MAQELLWCLANSQKLGGRCIAGHTKSGNFKRPISKEPDGTLHQFHYQLNDGTEPQILDVLAIDLEQPLPQPHQPENWIISNSKWQLRSRLGDGQITRDGYIKDLNNLSLKTSTIFGDTASAIQYTKLVQNPVSSSLALIKPNNLEFEISTYEQKKKIRATFLLNGQLYDLPITDDKFKNNLSQLPNGNYSVDNLEIPNFIPDNVFLTISLSQPFIPKNYNEFYCYKLVAAVISF